MFWCLYIVTASSVKYITKNVAVLNVVCSTSTTLSSYLMPFYMSILTFDTYLLFAACSCALLLKFSFECRTFNVLFLHCDILLFTLTSSSVVEQFL